ncbi:hypothetical protein LTR43_012706, partial [Exophiala xenobiotica]
DQGYDGRSHLSRHASPWQRQGHVRESASKRRAVHQSSSAPTSPDRAPNELGCSPPADHGFAPPVARLRGVQFLRTAAHEGSFEF